MIEVQEALFSVMKMESFFILVGLATVGIVLGIFVVTETWP
jgi:hypothetical protein